MRPAIPCAVLVFLTAAAPLAAQTGREAYRTAFQAWQKADPSLETDVATAGVAIAPRVRQAGEAAAAYTSARLAYLEQAAQPSAEDREGLENAQVASVPDLASVTRLADLVTASTESSNRMIAGLESDADPAILQFRRSLELERDALVALTNALEARAPAAAASRSSAETLASRSSTLVESLDRLEASRTAAAAHMGEEAGAWDEYYAVLREAAMGGPRSELAPGGPDSAGLAPANPTATITPVPLARYVGAWSFPVERGLFFGPEPEFVDLVVHEESGHVDGTLYGRFAVPEGSGLDPVVRFDFVGDLQPTGNQSFPLEAPDGSTGTIELIPGPAFNLLEVNFRLQPPAGDPRNGNFVLLKR